MVGYHKHNTLDCCLFNTVKAIDWKTVHAPPLRNKSHLHLSFQGLSRLYDMVPSPRLCYLANIHRCFWLYLFYIDVISSYLIWNDYLISPRHKCKWVSNLIWIISQYQTAKIRKLSLLPESGFSGCVCVLCLNTFLYLFCVFRICEFAVLPG